MEITEQRRLLAGRYRLSSVIGRGGMGTVWQAHDEILNRDVAVKELSWPFHFTEAEQATARHRSLREARIAARLQHASIVAVYDVVQEDDRPWIVMELLPYPSLGDIIGRDGPLPPARAAELGLGILAALNAAHAEGVLHRDVKPANIMVGPDGRVVLTDFGIARAADSATLTTSGMLVGSPSYIAPERAMGGKGDAAADLWGLGACLYTAVEGRAPFDRGDMLASMTAVVADEPALSRHQGPLQPVISGLLTKDPGKRLGPAEAERMLRQVASGGRAGWLRTRRHSRMAPVVGAAAGTALAATALALALVPGSGHQAPSPPAAPRMTTVSSSRGSSSAAATPSAPAASPASPSAPGPASADAGRPGTRYGALPAGYSRFTNSTGFSIGVPSGWRVSHSGHYVYISDPANGGIYLLIDQSDAPKSNPLADWEQQQANRAGSYPDYHLIRLEPVSYPQAEKAADWEFTYDRDGVLVHILNRNIRANARHAYALYWSTPQADWAAGYHYFQAFAATFRPAPA